MGLRLLHEALVEGYARLVLILEFTALLKGLVDAWIFVDLDLGFDPARFSGLRICSSLRGLLANVFLLISPAGVFICIQDVPDSVILQVLFV